MGSREVSPLQVSVKPLAIVHLENRVHEFRVEDYTLHGLRNRYSGLPDLETGRKPNLLIWTLGTKTKGASQEIIKIQHKLRCTQKFRSTSRCEGNKGEDRDLGNVAREPFQRRTTVRSHGDGLSGLRAPVVPSVKMTVNRKVIMSANPTLVSSQYRRRDKR